METHEVVANQGSRLIVTFGQVSPATPHITVANPPTVVPAGMLVQAGSCCGRGTLCPCRQSGGANGTCLGCPGCPFRNQRRLVSTSPTMEGK